MRLRNPLAVLKEYIQTKIHDRNRWSVNQIHQGTNASQQKKFAIVVCYPNPLPTEDTLVSCRHLNKCGYGVLLVSNGRLGSDFIAKALRHCVLVMERPNVGYDFGAYRDGIHYLERLGICPHALIIMNDSVLYPVFKDDAMLAWMETDPADVTGAVMVRERSRRIIRPKPPVLGSFFIRFGQKACAHPRLVEFWRDYRLTNKKIFVVRNGEHGLSNAIREAGLSMDAASTWEKARQIVLSMSDSEFQALIPELSRQELLNISDPTTRKIAVTQVATAICLKYLSLNVVKKNDVAGLTALKKFWNS